MRHHPGAFREQAALLRRQFLHDCDLPFADVLTDQVLADALAAAGHWLDRVFSPLVTLRVFLGQVLSATTRAGPPSPGLPAGSLPQS